MDERMIKSPKHYTEGRRFEPKDVIRDWDLNFNLGNAVKYLARAGRKGDMVEDLKKAQQYIQFEIDALAAEGGEKAPCDKEAVDPFASLVRMLETEVKPIMVKIPEGVDVDKVLAYRFSPQEARAVLPNSLKTEVVMTANLREWRHFFSLRACGTTGKPHPQMLEVAVPLLKEVKSLIPVVFDDLEPLES